MDTDFNNFWKTYAPDEALPRGAFKSFPEDDPVMLAS